MVIHLQHTPVRDKVKKGPTITLILDHDTRLRATRGDFKWFEINPESQMAHSTGIRYSARSSVSLPVADATVVSSGRFGEYTLLTDGH